MRCSRCSLNRDPPGPRSAITFCSPLLYNTGARVSEIIVFALQMSSSMEVPACIYMQGTQAAVRAVVGRQPLARSASGCGGTQPFRGQSALPPEP